ncbi:MAG: hypothetical protein H6807_07250 [Planctomycetes bacterium]|nr:hypothetical protein [Planctomycetota bacterium]
MKILRGIVAIVLGWFTGSVANMGLVMLGIALVPPPGIPAELRGFEVMISRQEEFYEALAAALPKFGVLDYLFPFLAHALGTLVGASVAAWLAPIRKARFAWAIGLLFLAGGITNVAMLPAPLWFEAADLILAYLPMAWIAARLVARSEG